MTIYTVDINYKTKKPALYSLEVEETPKMLRVPKQGRRPSLEFHCRTQFGKDEYPTSAQGAWERFVQVRQAFIGNAKASIEAHTTQLEYAKEAIIALSKETE
jgi:hypothetical protein